LFIVYSESKKGELLSLATLLHEKDIRFQPWALPERFGAQDSDDLMHSLKAHTHWVFLVAASDNGHPAYLFAAGYCLALHERCYILDPEGTLVPGSWKSSINVAPDFASLVESLEAERVRWGQFLLRLEAKGRLVERGLEVSNTAFIDAVRQGDQTSCELFLDAGFAPDLTDKKGVSLLCLAVRSSHMGVLKLLLDAGADVNLRSRDRDNSPVMDAAAEGQTEIVSELLRRGADLGGVSRNGQNALVLAIGKGAQDVAALLLEAGGDPFVADKLGMNACQYAQMLGRTEFLELVRTRFPGRV
jgi:hypothetical protein